VADLGQGIFVVTAVTVGLVAGVVVVLRLRLVGLVTHRTQVHPKEIMGVEEMAQAGPMGVGVVGHLLLALLG
jgi:hypothetical protein